MLMGAAVKGTEVLFHLNLAGAGGGTGGLTERPTLSICQPRGLQALMAHLYRTQ